MGCTKARNTPLNPLSRGDFLLLFGQYCLNLIYSFSQKYFVCYTLNICPYLLYSPFKRGARRAGCVKFILLISQNTQRCRNLLLGFICTPRQVTPSNSSRPRPYATSDQGIDSLHYFPPLKRMRHPAKYTPLNPFSKMDF